MIYKYCKNDHLVIFTSNHIKRSLSEYNDSITQSCSMCNEIVQLNLSEQQIQHYVSQL
jgi:hypothetical protein